MAKRFIADYLLPDTDADAGVPGDPSKTLDAASVPGNHRTFTFKVSEDTAWDQPFILAFTANPLDPDDLVLHVVAGEDPSGSDHTGKKVTPDEGVTIRDYTFNSNETNIRTIHEIIQG